MNFLFLLQTLNIHSIHSHNTYDWVWYLPTDDILNVTKQAERLQPIGAYVQGTCHSVQSYDMTVINVCIYSMGLLQLKNNNNIILIKMSVNPQKG